jgi:Do/DeqQ family serine protease
VAQGLAGILIVTALIFAGTACKNTKAQNNAPKAPLGPTAVRTSFADVVDRVGPSVVTVRSERRVRAPQQAPYMDDDFFRQFFGGRVPQQQQQQPQSQVERGLGSGVIVNADGTILTNFHVVDGAEDIKVDLIDKRTLPAKVIGTDKASDLAVLKVEGDNFPALALGDSDKMRVGDVVLAVGNPLGLEQTVTMGIISAKDRRTGLGDGGFEDFLQTDAPINHGNSGGALVNTDGELIGINSQILSPSGGSIGIGFAIPSNMAKGVMDQLLAGGQVHRGQLGVGIQPVTSDLAASLGLTDVRGVVVNQVTPGSPAERAGIKTEDVITAFNGASVNDSNDLRNKVASTKPGTEVNLTIVRGGHEQQVKATLGEFHPAEEQSSNAAPPADQDSGALGIQVQPLTPELASQVGVPAATQGLIVAGVSPGSPADDAGIARGDVITQINRQPIRTTADVKAALAKSGNKPALLLVNRKGSTVYLPVKVS